jgi:serine/threonine-protein kinase
MQEAPRKLGVVIAAVGAVLVALVAVFFLMGRSGELMVDVRDPKGAPLARAEIFIDGRKVCDSTPCVVTDLDAGSRLVKVTAPGYQTPPPATAEVSGGQRSEVLITMPPATGTLAAKGDQPGVKVYVDGVDRGALPAKLEDLQPGAREVRFDGGERYKSMERVVDVKAGEVTDLGAVRLDVLRGQITIELGSSGRSDDARVTIQKDEGSASAKVVAGPFPKTIELDGGAKWRVVASKRGLPDYVARFDFADGIAVKTVRISMEPEKAEEPPDEPPPDEPPPAAPTPATPTPPSAPSPPDRPRDPPKEEPKETASGGSGSVNINSIPVSRVLVDGTPMGETPLSGVKLPAGLHTVTFIHPELGRKSVVVKVEPGKTSVASARLRD